MERRRLESRLLACKLGPPRAETRKGRYHAELAIASFAFVAALCGGFRSGARCTPRAHSLPAFTLGSLIILIQSSKFGLLEVKQPHGKAFLLDSL